MDNYETVCIFKIMNIRGKLAAKVRKLSSIVIWYASRRKHVRLRARRNDNVRRIIDTVEKALVANEMKVQFRKILQHSNRGALRNSTRSISYANHEPAKLRIPLSLIESYLFVSDCQPAVYIHFVRLKSKISFSYNQAFFIGAVWQLEYTPRGAKRKTMIRENFNNSKTPGFVDVS